MAGPEHLDHDRPEPPAHGCKHSDRHNMTELPNSWLPKEKIKILLLEGISETAVVALRASGYVNAERLTKALEGPTLKSALGGVHLLGIRSRTQLTAEVISWANDLIAIGCFSVGTNKVDLGA